MSLEIADIEFWVKEALKSEKVYDLEVFKHTKPRETTNFQAELMFVTANGIDIDQKRVSHELLVKMGKQNKELRQKLPLRVIYEREVYMYRTVLPKYKDFETDKHLAPFSSIPKCYGTFLTVDPEQEVIIMENFSKLGFELQDKNYFNGRHMEATLEMYAHFHALSLAFEDQKPKEFVELTKDLVCPFREYINNTNFIILPDNVKKFTLEILEHEKQPTILEMFKGKINDNVTEILNKMSVDAEKVDHAVFVHGDCWRTNFMFKYKESDTKKEDPEKVVMFDFQMSTLSSLTWDLAFHLYCVLPVEEFGKIQDYLKMYHSFLSRKLNQLGSNPEELFPFSKLAEHWTKYSFIGVWLSLVVHFVVFERSKCSSDKNLESFKLEEDKINLRVVGILQNWFFDVNL